MSGAVRYSFGCVYIHEVSKDNLTIYNSNVEFIPPKLHL